MYGRRTRQGRGIDHQPAAIRLQGDATKRVPHKRRNECGQRSHLNPVNDALNAVNLQRYRSPAAGDDDRRGRRRRRRRTQTAPPEHSRIDHDHGMALEHHPDVSHGPDFSRILNAENIFKEHRKPARADTELQQAPRHDRPFSNHRDFL
jgi:hypothetical protein